VSYNLKQTEDNINCRHHSSDQDTDIHIIMRLYS